MIKYANHALEINRFMLFIDKSLTFIRKKLEKVYINFWEFYNLALLFENIYITILICKKTKKDIGIILLLQI